MTGATRGIGRHAAARLLAEAPRLHLVVLARGTSGEALAESLSRHRDRLTVLEADLLSLDSVRTAADRTAHMLTAGALPPLRGLLLNGGVQHTSSMVESAEGFEATFAVNVLAPHLLIRRLGDHMPEPARIVLTVSDTHFGDLRHNLGLVPGPQWKAPETLARPGAFSSPAGVTAGRIAYSTSKLAAVHLIHEHARRLPPGVVIAGFNPGLVPATGIARSADALSRFAMRWVMPALALTPLAVMPRTAGRQLARMLLDETPAPHGGYVSREQVVASSAESYDPARERELWDLAERLTASSAPPA